jgi:hypothetical protein
MIVSELPGLGRVVEVVDELETESSAGDPTAAEPIPTAIRTVRTVAINAAVRLNIS